MYPGFGSNKPKTETNKHITVMGKILLGPKAKPHRTTDHFFSSFGFSARSKQNEKPRDHVPPGASAWAHRCRGPSHGPRAPAARRPRSSGSRPPGSASSQAGLEAACAFFFFFSGVLGMNPGFGLKGKLPVEWFWGHSNSCPAPASLEAAKR